MRCNFEPDSGALRIAISSARELARSPTGLRLHEKDCMARFGFRFHAGTGLEPRLKFGQDPVRRREVCAEPAAGASELVRESLGSSADVDRVTSARCRTGHTECSSRVCGTCTFFKLRARPRECPCTSSPGRCLTSFMAFHVCEDEYDVTDVLGLKILSCPAIIPPRARVSS